VQLPGVKDQQRAIELVGKTALLEFKLVDEGASVEDASRERPRDRPAPLPEVGGSPDRPQRRPHAREEAGPADGRHDQDGEGELDSQRGRHVSLFLRLPGGQGLRPVTAENVKRRLAIVLDDTIYSAPVIQERISGGEAQITGSFTAEEASDLAIVLRAGSLPAPVKVIQNVSIGPSLGQDSIRKGSRRPSSVRWWWWRSWDSITGSRGWWRISRWSQHPLPASEHAALSATLTYPASRESSWRSGWRSTPTCSSSSASGRRSGRRNRTVSIDAGYDKAFMTVVAPT